MNAAPISLVAHPKPELLGMRGIASRLVVSSLLSSNPKLGKLPKMTLLLLALIWILASWDCGRLHTSDTPVSSAIRTTSTISALTGTHRCHPCTLTLVVMRKGDWMFLFDGDQFSHQLVKDLAAR